MTAINQNFSMYQGDTKNIILTVDGISDLTGATVKWGVRKYERSLTNDFMKESSTGDISISGNEITIKLKPADTQNLLGGYFHECELTDQQGNVSTIMTGTMTVLRSGV